VALPELAFDAVFKQLNNVDGLTPPMKTSFTHTDVGSFIKFNAVACEDLNVTQAPSFNLSFSNSDGQDLDFYISLESLMTNVDDQCTLMLYNMGETETTVQLGMAFMQQFLIQI